MGMIFQEYALVDRLSVMGKRAVRPPGLSGLLASARRKFPRKMWKRPSSCWKRVGLADYVDTRADQLSGGQRQRWESAAPSFAEATDLLK